MFRIAICDDNEIICSQIEKIILDSKNNYIEKIDILIFSSGEGLYKFIKEGQAFDLIFLDIEMNELNGVEVGRIIRKELKDDITQIVYISAKKDYALELFDNRPLNFLVKPLCAQKIVENLDLAMKLYENDNSYFEFSKDATFQKIPYKKIIYFASDNKNVHVITIEGEYKYRGKLSDLEIKIKDKNFIPIHKSYFVNYTYIDKVKYDSIILTNEKELPISRSNRKKVSDIFFMRKK